MGKDVTGNENGSRSFGGIFVMNEVENMAKYTMGIDSGTLSGRAVIVNIETGEEMTSAASTYEHAVMS